MRKQKNPTERICLVTKPRDVFALATRNWVFTNLTSFFYNSICKNDGEESKAIPALYSKP